MSAMRAAHLACALLLLAGASIVQGGLISISDTTRTYSCDPATCQPATCLCPSNSPPGNLTVEQIPQFVLIGHDNALDGLPYALMVQLLGNKTQKNGCSVPVTWFAERYHSDCAAGQAALARGHEVAMQANRFSPSDPFTATDPSPNYNSRDPVTGQPSVEIEITMSRKWWNEECGLPLKDMVGFRAQEYYNNPPVRQALSKNGWLYDSTLVERYYPGSPTSPSANETLWPYTMDAGIVQECDFFGPEVGKCNSSESYKGLWEVPLYQWQDGDTMLGVSGYGDTRIPGMPAIPDMLVMLKQQLKNRLYAGRTPFTINTFYEWMTNKPETPPADDPNCLRCLRPPSANGLALANFVEWATVNVPEVRFVTYSDLIRWMQDPVPLDQFDSWVECKVPGVKADLTAVNLTAADKAGAFYLAGSAPAGTPAPAAAPGAAPPKASAPPPDLESAASPPGSAEDGMLVPQPSEDDGAAPAADPPAPMKRRRLHSKASKRRLLQRAG